jgi:hypothetical protein
MRRRRKPCTFAGCKNHLVAKGLCYAHRRQQFLGQKLRPLRPQKSLPESLQSEIRKLASIPILEGISIYLSTRGYPVVNLRIDGKRHTGVKVHRLVMEHALGRRLTPQEVVHHKGDRRNPSLSNLFLSENQSDHLRKCHPELKGLAKLNAQKKFCKRGHPLFGRNLRPVRGGRSCITCANWYRRNWRKARRILGLPKC